MFDKVKKTATGTFYFHRGSNCVEFICERCEAAKKSKTQVRWVKPDGSESVICNGCYGCLLSKS
jgi:hypothetical protein